MEYPERFGPYRVLSVVGEGGMGVVYKAEDQRLGRIVALKVIREFAGDAVRRRRFWQEARAAAQVAHPHACQIYDVAEEQDRLVLVMEFIEGESLAHRLERGPLNAQESGEIALALLSALEAFHKVGIVHRDLKPSNVVLSRSGTKLLDFGIAKNVSPNSNPEAMATLDDSTAPGIFLGTPRYASPEQFRGQPVDARSDLFSLGVILFEMLTGELPFPGNSFGEVAHAVLQGAPRELSGSPAIEAMGRVVHRALSREPQQRYASAEEMSGDLRTALKMAGVDSTARADRLRRIIVLPFRMLRPDENVQFLAFSLPEAITVSLAGLDNVIVRSSIVAARYSPEALDLQKIAKEAEVDVVLTGALLSLGQRLRITTQLVEVPSGTLLWSRASEASSRELLELHDDLVARVVESVLPSLTAKAHQSLQQDRPASSTVYQLYLQANEFSRQWENLPTAIALYERCVNLDPMYAPAWARLGRARWLSDKYNVGSLEGLHSADEAFQTALRLNPNLTLAHNLYTHVQVDQGRSLDALKRLLGRAQQRRSDAELFAGLGHVCRYCGLLRPALTAHQEARRLDPLIPTSVMHTYFLLGDYERALENSGSDYGYGLGMVLAVLGRTEEAVQALHQRETLKPWRLGRLYLTSLRALLEGRREESLRASEELMQATFRDPEGMFYLARQLAYLQAEEQALEMLTRAIDHGFLCHEAMGRDPWFDALRSRTEFVSLAKKAEQLSQEALSAYRAGGGGSLLGTI